MSAGHVGVAIRSMLTLPRRGRRWPRGLWIACGAAPVVVGGGLVAAGLPPTWALGSLALLVPAVAKLVGRLWTWIAFIVAVGLGLGALPLFGVLGYELAVAMALVAAVLGLDVGAALARELQRLPAPGLTRAAYAGATLGRAAVGAAGVTAGLVAIPAVIAAVRGAFWLPTCDWWFGIEAYLALPIVTALLAGATGFAIGVIAGPRRFLGAALAQVPLVGVAVAALLRFYGAPPVFTYNAVLGYFPGNLYDENVQLEAALLWSRLEQGLWVIALVALIAVRFDVPRFRLAREPRPYGRRTGAWTLMIACALAATGLHTQSGTLGYAVDADDIADALGGRLETPHFVIHYSKTPEIEEVIGLVAADHEFRLAQVTKELGVVPAGKLRSFYFADRDTKARWMGARDVEMAKPWRREIYLEHRAFPHGALRHEIAHAVAAEFGDPLFGVAARQVLGVPVFVSPGLIEGLAVAVDWPGTYGYERLTPHEAVRALQLMGKQPSIGQLLSLQFFSMSSATGYTTAGSFLRFLLDTYGAAPLRALYGSGGDFTGAYGKSLAVLEAEWVAMISTIELPREIVEGTRERFRGVGVFSRPCPHAIAKRREEALEALGRGDRGRAVELMRDVCGDAPEEPRYRLVLGDLLHGGDLYEQAEAHALWTGLAYDERRVTSSIRADAFEKLARTAALRGDDAAVRRYVATAVTLPINVNDRRQLDALALALAHAGPAGPALRGYFFAASRGIEPPTWARLATIAEPHLGFGHYLLGLQHLNQGELVAAAAALELALQRGLPGVAFVKNAARRLAIAAFRTGDRRRVELAIAALSGGGTSTGDRLLAEDWFARLAFDVAR